MVDVTMPIGARPTRPGWGDVEDLIARLRSTGATFSTATAAESSISQYEPGVRLMLESKRGTRWVAIPDVRACWETLERLGDVSRGDLLEPGRCSAFMFALFAQLDGVEAAADGEARLSLPRR